MVLVVAPIEAAAKTDRRFDHEVVAGLESLVSVALALRQEHVEDGAGGVEFELVVAALVGGGLEEQLEGVVLPQPAVVLGDLRVQVDVVHVGHDVQILAVPQEAGAGGGLCRPGVFAQPGGGEAVDDLRGGPRGFVGGAVDLDGSIRPAALELGHGGARARQ